MIVLITGHFSNSIPCQIPQNSAEISKFRGKGQILWLRLKFRGPRKTVGPTDDKM